MKQLRIDSCSEDRNKMQKTGCGWHCDKCAKAVHDLSNVPRERAIELVEEANGEMCIAVPEYYTYQWLKPVYLTNLNYPARKKNISGAILTSFLLALNTQAQVSNTTEAQTVVKNVTVKQDSTKFSLLPSFSTDTIVIPHPLTIATNTGFRWTVDSIPGTWVADFPYKFEITGGVPLILGGGFDISTLFICPGLFVFEDPAIKAKAELEKYIAEGKIRSVGELVVIFQSTDNKNPIVLALLGDLNEKEAQNIKEWLEGLDYTQLPEEPKEAPNKYPESQPFVLPLSWNLITEPNPSKRGKV